ncbi:M48 family metallopeptidase [Candidatus Thioglobus sp.]|uniref:M48 family metallopeptidase n=1 Tax=Candidatus Thioglobus sp. TaxID=2026721 RepID=UPI003D0CFA33
MKKIQHYLLLSALLVSLSGCLTQSTKQGQVGIERKQLLLVSDQQMTQGAKQAYSEVISDAKEEKNLNTNKVMLRRVRTIANRLIAQVGVFRADAKDWAWEANVIESDKINAWCMPGGKIMFYSGIITKLELNDDEIAAIMGHEIAHALREHGRERASQQLLSKIGIDLFSSLTGVKGSGLDLTNLVLKTTVLLPNSRTHETEADRMGVELAARAGYDPRYGANVWRKMSKQKKTKGIEMLSTHPSNESRIADLEDYSNRVLHLYQKAKS